MLVRGHDATSRVQYPATHLRSILQDNAALITCSALSSLMIIMSISAYSTSTSTLVGLRQNATFSLTNFVRLRKSFGRQCCSSKTSHM